MEDEKIITNAPCTYEYIPEIDKVAPVRVEEPIGEIFLGHSFKELYADFISGTPIKRRGWRGYWKYNRGRIYIHAKDGTVIDLQKCKDILFTLSHLTQYDWEVATNENCDIPVN